MKRRWHNFNATSRREPAAWYRPCECRGSITSRVIVLPSGRQQRVERPFCTVCARQCEPVRHPKGSPRVPPRRREPREWPAMHGADLERECVRAVTDDLDRVAALDKTAQRAAITRRRMTPLDAALIFGAVLAFDSRRNV